MLLNLAVLHLDSKCSRTPIHLPKSSQGRKYVVKIKTMAYFPPSPSIFQASANPNYFIFWTLGVLKINNLIISSYCYFYLVPIINPHLIQNLVDELLVDGLLGRGWITNKMPNENLPKTYQSCSALYCLLHSLPGSINGLLITNMILFLSADYALHRTMLYTELVSYIILLIANTVVDLPDLRQGRNQTHNLYHHPSVASK